MPDAGGKEANCREEGEEVNGNVRARGEGDIDVVGDGGLGNCGGGKSGVEGAECIEKGKEVRPNVSGFVVGLENGEEEARPAG